MTPRSSARPRPRPSARADGPAKAQYPVDSGRPLLAPALLLRRLQEDARPEGLHASEPRPDRTATDPGWQDLGGHQGGQQSGRAFLARGYGQLEHKLSDLLVVHRNAGGVLAS